MLPTGQLHVMHVDAQDGRSRYQCRTLHRLTGRTKESITAGRILIAGKFFEGISVLFMCLSKHTILV